MERTLISVQEARRLIAENVRVGSAEQRSIQDAKGLHLAEDIRAKRDMPPFDNSAMDGYGLRFNDVSHATDATPVALKLTGELAAGSSHHEEIQPGHAVRIFTGAPVPPGVDSVIRQEDVKADGDRIVIYRAVRSGENIRRQGEEAKAGDVILGRGQKVNPAAMGVLAGQGIHEVLVHCPPRVGILVTGSEIVASKCPLSTGMILDSNSPALTTALAEVGIETALCQTCTDDLDLVKTAISSLLENCDVLLITGGVSVGKHDYVKEAAQQIGLEQIFWRVKQKPGKPLYFAATPSRHKLVFGLPGNPASVLTGFYQYVRPALLSVMGATNVELHRSLGQLRGSYRKSAGLTHFLKGHIDREAQVRILEGQGSHMMASYAQANCLVVMEENETELKEGDVVRIHILPV